MLAARLVALGLVVALGLGRRVVLLARRRRRRRRLAVRPGVRDTPLVVRGLRKEYADGFVAVAKVDFTVQRGPGASACSARTAPARPPRCGC